MQHSTSRKMINSKDSLKMPWREEHRGWLSGWSGGQGRVWCQGPSHLQAEVGSWGTPVQPQPWALGYKEGPQPGRAGLCGAGELWCATGQGGWPLQANTGFCAPRRVGALRGRRGTVRRDGALGLIELSRDGQISTKSPLLTLRKWNL